MVELNARVDAQDSARCCEQVEALAEQLAAAIDAIAHHQLTALEQSIEAQQHCLAKLLLTANWVEEARRRSPAIPQVHARLSASVQTLVRLNKQYSALIEHTSRSLHMFQAVDPSYALTALRSGSALSLAGSTIRDFAKRPVLSWHG